MPPDAPIKSRTERNKIMKPVVVGVFKTRSAAQSAAAKLVPLGIAKDKINILTPDVTQTELAQLPTQAAEQPGMGKAMGATVGGAIGLAAAGTLPAFLGSLLVPGVGPILAIGLAGGVLGAVAGGVAGGAMESSTTEGLPEDELFVYEDALRQGHSAVIAIAANDQQAQVVRGALEEAGAESIDRAREMWWVGLRDTEKDTYQAHGRNFDEDERYFRCALRLPSIQSIAASLTRSVAPASATAFPATTSASRSSAVTNTAAPTLRP
jgi:hypothetical protein